MKKRTCFLIALLAVLVLFFSGCGAGKEKAAEDQKTLTGTLEEVKDFMILVEDEKGDCYALSFGDEKPKGLKDQTQGSKVTVTYTGELSVVDGLDGEIISVEAAQ